MGLPHSRRGDHRLLIKTEVGNDPTGWSGRDACALGGLIAAAVFVYFPALQGGWLWDDGAEIAANPLLRDPAGLPKIWAGAQGDDYFPLKSTLQWFEWRLWGENVAGYHLANIGLQVLSAVLLWRLLGRLGLRLGWIGGLIWVVHPLAVESVAWIAEFKNPLSLVFLLGAMIGYVDFDSGGDTKRWRVPAFAMRKLPRRSPTGEGGPDRSGSRQAFVGGRTFPYLWSLVLFLAALLSKSSVVMFPVVLLLYAWWRRGRIGWAEARASGPFFALSLTLGLVTVWFQIHRVIARVIMPPFTLTERLISAFCSVPFYLEKSLLPWHLLPIYPGWPSSGPSGGTYLAWFALLVLLAWAWARRRGAGRHLLLGAGFFLLNLLPVLGLIPLAYARISPVADHLGYLSLIGLVGLAAAGAEAAWNSRPRSLRPAWVLGGVVICAGLAAQARSYAGQFASDERLWTYTLARNPLAWLAHNNLALDLMKRSQPEEAVAHDQLAAKLEPAFAEVHSNLGVALLEAGRGPEAIAECREAIRLRPDLAGAHFNLGFALMKSGRWTEAIAPFERALALDPENADAEANLGSALAHEGRWTEAIAHDETALRLRPLSPQTENNLANALANAGRLAEAIGHYQASLRLRPGDPGTHRNFGLALRTLGRESEAEEQLEEASRLAPH